MPSSPKLGAKRAVVDENSQEINPSKKYRNSDNDLEDTAFNLVDFDIDFYDVRPVSAQNVESGSRAVFEDGFAQKELVETMYSLQLSDCTRTRDVLSLRIFAHELKEKLAKLNRNFDSLLGDASPPAPEASIPRVMPSLCESVTEEVHNHARELRKIVDEAAKNKRTKDKLSRMEIPVDAGDWKARSEMKRKDQESIQRLSFAADKLEECVHALYRLQEVEPDDIAKERRLRRAQKKFTEARRCMDAPELSKRERPSGRIRKRLEDTASSLQL